MRTLLSFAILLLSLTAQAFEYEIEKPVLEGASTPGHETLTSLAIDCLQIEGENGAQPSDCLGDKQSIKAYRSMQSFVVPSISGEAISAEEMMDASSWPDDPTRLGSYFGAVINLFQVCDNFWSFLGFEEHYESISGGLACNSHFGVLQFFHAQASSINEPYQHTRNKILAWIRFNYAIVQDASVLKKSYCQYFSELKKNQQMLEMARAFLPEGHDDLEQCENNDTIGWIYSSKCTNLIASEDCDHIDEPKTAQITALGAIIHVIQDSYSLSHTKRGQCSAEENNKPVSMIRCRPIEQFYTYNVQDAGKHNASDVLPVNIGGSCGAGDTENNKIDDAVTATAVVLWHAANRKSENALMSYLESAVFTEPDYTSKRSHHVQAGGGRCYLEPEPVETVTPMNQNEMEFRRRLMGQINP